MKCWKKIWQGYKDEIQWQTINISVRLNKIFFSNDVLVTFRWGKMKIVYEKISK